MSDYAEDSVDRHVLGSGSLCCFNYCTFKDGSCVNYLCVSNDGCQMSQDSHDRREGLLNTSVPLADRLVYTWNFQSLC